MSHREKIAWLYLIAMIVTFGPYFAHVSLHPPGDAMPNLSLLWTYAGVVTVQVIIIIIGHLFFHFQSPQESGAPPDERDRLIARRAVNAAYYVLITGAIMVGCVMPFYASGWKIINATFFAIVIAELVHYGVTIVSYRRQA